MNEGINKILRPLGHMPLNHFRRIYCYLLFLSKGILRFWIIDDLQSIIVDLYPIRECPHLIKFIFVLVYYYLSVYIVLEHPYLDLIAFDLVHCEILLGKGVL